MTPANNHIYQQLRDRIVTVDYKPGEPLNEKRLAAEFNVSRTPIRETLIRLCGDGFVRLTPRRGAHINDVNLQDFKSLIDYRILLEKGLAPLVIAHMDDVHIHQLEQLHQTVQKAPADQIKALMGCDTRYHAILRSAAGNPLLDRDLGNIQLHFTRVEYLIRYKPKRLPVELPETIAALKEHDGRKLEQLLVEHVHFFVKQVKRSL